jgi:Spy/CpxP family protein refolding chaperone
MDMGEMGISADESKLFDQRFIEAMISHHQGAIDMAQMTLQMAEHEEIKTLAEAIIAAQQAEIEQMQGWLQEWYGAGSALSRYVAHLDSPVRGLSVQEVDDLLAGRGMGYARTAELNSHPGPRHVLDLQKELNLSAAQVGEIEASFAAMQTQAQQLGALIIVQEQQLSAAFASGAIDEVQVEAQVMALADLYGQLRVTHLRAHLQVTSLLNTEQVVAYNEQRGYTSGNEQLHAHERHR